MRTKVFVYSPSDIAAATAAAAATFGARGFVVVCPPSLPISGPTGGYGMPVLQAVETLKALPNHSPMAIYVGGLGPVIK